jgi:hypothetical protein
MASENPGWVTGYSGWDGQPRSSDHPNTDSVMQVGRNLLDLVGALVGKKY